MSLLMFVISVTSGIIGASMANARGKDASLWFIVCALIPLLVIVALAVGNNRQPNPSTDRNLPDRADALTARQDHLAPFEPKQTESLVDTDIWKTLREFDDEIQQAVAEISTFGRSAEERLATAYLAVKDKNLLKAIVTKIIVDCETAKSEKALLEAQQKAKLTELDLRNLEGREGRSRLVIKSIEDMGMTYDGKKVISAKMYDGDQADLRGWAVIVYENGSTELRTGTSVIYRS